MLDELWRTTFSDLFDEVLGLVTVLRELCYYVARNFTRVLDENVRSKEAAE